MLYKIKYTNRFGSPVRRREDGEEAKIPQSGPNSIRLYQITPAWEQITSECAKLHQSVPNYTRVGQITSEWAKLHQSGPDYIIVCQITSEWSKLLYRL